MRFNYSAINRIIFISIYRARAHKIYHILLILNICTPALFFHPSPCHSLPLSCQKFRIVLNIAITSSEYTVLFNVCPCRKKKWETTRSQHQLSLNLQSAVGSLSQMNRLFVRLPISRWKYSGKRKTVVTISCSDWLVTVSHPISVHKGIRPQDDDANI